MPPEAKRKRPGGLRQRLAQAEADERGRTMGDQSHLAQFLLELYAWGEMSPQMVQRVAKLVLHDIHASADNPRVLNDLEVLAGIGTGGTHKNKCHADLMAKVEKMSLLPSPFRVMMPFKQPLGDAPQGILLPHEMFAALFHNYQNTWKRSVVPSDKALRAFWTDVDMHPQMRDHPIKDKENWKMTTVPLAIHGDGVPIVGLGKGWSRVMTQFSWYSLVGQGATRELLFWVWGMYDKLCTGGVADGTRGKFFAVLKWSLMTMMEGVWPTHDFEGNEHLVLQCECLLWFCLSTSLSNVFFKVTVPIFDPVALTQMIMLPHVYGALFLCNPMLPHNTLY